MDYSNRPPRGRQLLPTQPEQRAYLKKIREAADGGEVMAMAAVLLVGSMADQAEALDEIKVKVSSLSAAVEADASRRRLEQIQQEMHAVVDNARSVILAAIDRDAAAREVQTK